MSWINDEANENNKRETAERSRQNLIATSNYWEKLVRQVEADVKAINEHDYWKKKLNGIPLAFRQVNDGYEVSKSGSPGVIVGFWHDGEYIQVSREFFEENPVSEKVEFRANEPLEIDTSGRNVIVRSPYAPNQYFVVPEQASQYILKVVIESLKITETE